MASHRSIAGSCSGRRNSIYLRLSVTPECNLRCRYCHPPSDECHPPSGERHPPSGERLAGTQDRISDDELIRLVTVIHGVRPLRKLRFTGGEPLLKRGLPGLIKTFRRLLPHTKLALTTNGILLEDQAASLSDAGLHSLNISLDTLDASRFRKLSCFDGHEKVLEGIRAARTIGFKKIKLNTVQMRSYNFDQLPDLVRFAARHGCEIRFVELMPFGQGANLFAGEYYSADEALKELQDAFTYLRPVQDSDTAKRHVLEVDGKEVTVGFITPVSRPFCATCDRLRLDSYGRLFACLREETGIDLSEKVREGSAGEAEKWIKITLAGKKAPGVRWPARPMVQLGG